MKILRIFYHTLQTKKALGYFLLRCLKRFRTLQKNSCIDPIEITVGNKNESTSNVSHEYYLVNARDRYQALKRLADAHPDIFSVIFCRTKRDTQKVAENLIEERLQCRCITRRFKSKPT